jgi:hypothetical protein
MLKDLRRTRRAVFIAERLATEPAASFPTQMKEEKEVIALYRFLDAAEVTYAALMQPHWQQTRDALAEHPVVLLVQDTTDLDLSHYPSMQGLGPVGNERGRGVLLQTVLAVEPRQRRVLGCAHQHPFLRVPAPAGETRTQRQQRPRETDIWRQMVQEIGPPPAQTQVVHVGDRGADIFTFFQACRQHGTHFLVRVAQNRRIAQDADAPAYLVDQMRGWPAQDTRPFAVPGSHGRQARQSHLHVAWGPIRLLPPQDTRGGTSAPLDVWGVRLWEEQPPEGEAPLEWLLLTSVPTTTSEEAWERGDWYRCRWKVEDYHQCLKTGCRIEHRHVHTLERYQRLLGLVAPVAVRLVQMRDLVQTTPDVPAETVMEPDLVAVVATRTGVDRAGMTLGAFWRAVASLGGYLGRKGDGPPGWKTIWKGWGYVQTLWEGVRLAAHLRL